MLFTKIIDVCCEKKIKGTNTLWTGYKVSVTTAHQRIIIIIIIIIIPVLKRGKSTYVTNYRSISLLSTFPKYLNLLLMTSFRII
jgi:hypothetical protein